MKTSKAIPLLVFALLTLLLTSSLLAETMSTHVSDSLAKGSASIAQGTASIARSTASIAKNTVSLAEDTAITTYIYAKLASNNALSNSNIDVSTHEGKVTLNGIVNDDNEARMLAQLAESTSGVKSVDASRIIVAQQDNKLFIKVAANTPPPVTSNDPNQAPIIHKGIQITSTNPILTAPAATPAAPVMAKHASSPHVAIRLSHHKIHHLLNKPRKANFAHLSHVRHKKVFAAVKVKKNHPKKLVVKKKSHHTTTVMLQRHPVEKMKKKPQVLTQKNNHATVDQMTSNYLKTALLANKPVAEDD